MFVVVTGNIASGFTILGPFDTEFEADEYQKCMEDYGNDEVVVMEVQTP
jgi:hypothetical protein